MKDQKQVDLWARRLEGVELMASEQAELATAVIESPEFAEMMAADQNMHELLQAHYRISVTANEFLARCQQMAGRHLAATSVDVEVEPSLLLPAGPISSAPTRETEISQSLQIDLNSGGKIAVAHRIATRRGQPKLFGPVLAYSLAAIALIGFAGWLIGSQFSSQLGSSRNSTRNLAQPSESSSPSKFQKREDQFRAEALSHRDVVAANQSGHALPKDPASDRRGDTPSNSGEDLAVVDPIGSERLPENPLSAPFSASDAKWIRTSEDCEWVSIPGESAPFPRSFDLKSGIAEINVPAGPVVTMRGPASLSWDDADHISVKQGEVQFEFPENPSGLSLFAPHVQLTPNGSSQFFLTAHPEEPTLVEVAAGKITATPWLRAETIPLTAERLNRGAFGPPWTAESREPATAIAVSNSGEMHGIVDVANRPLTITEPGVLAQVLETSQEELKEKPEQFQKDWKRMVEQVNGVTSGEMSVNGETQTIQSPQDFLKKMQEIQGRMQGANANSTGGFSGAINVNGEERRFDSPEEFSKAQEQIFGPLFSQVFQNKSAMKKSRPDSRNGNSRTGDSQGETNSFSAFSGMINVNGNAQTFNRQEDFERAMRDFRRKR